MDYISVLLFAFINMDQKQTDWINSTVLNIRKLPSRAIKIFHKKALEMASIQRSGEKNVYQSFHQSAQVHLDQMVHKDYSKLHSIDLTVNYC